MKTKIALTSMPGAVVDFAFDRRQLALLRPRSATHRLEPAGNRHQPRQCEIHHAALEDALDNQPRELNSLTAPVNVEWVTTDKGMAEIVIVGGASDNLFALDADSGKLIWKKSFEAERQAAPGAFLALSQRAERHAADSQGWAEGHRFRHRRATASCTR
jgi:hypothetical protein